MLSLAAFRSGDDGAATVDWLVMLICIAALALWVIHYVFSGLAPTLEIIENTGYGLEREPVDE